LRVRPGLFLAPPPPAIACGCQDRKSVRWSLMRFRRTNTRLRFRSCKICRDRGYFQAYLSLNQFPSISAEPPLLELTVMVSPCPHSNPNYMPSPTFRPSRGTVAPLLGNIGGWSRRPRNRVPQVFPACLTVRAAQSSPPFWSSLRLHLPSPRLFALSSELRLGELRLALPLFSGNNRCLPSLPLEAVQTAPP